MSAIRQAFKRSATYFSRYGKCSTTCHYYQYQRQRRFTAMALTQLSEEEQMFKDSGTFNKTRSLQILYLLIA